MLRKVFVFFSIALLLTKLFYGIGWFVNYQINKAEIAARYCENKNRPELHCNGQCYLAKQLRKADQELQQKESNQKERLQHGQLLLESTFYIATEKPNYQLLQEVAFSQQMNASIQYWKESLYSFTIDQPPRV